MENKTWGIHGPAALNHFKKLSTGLYKQLREKREVDVATKKVTSNCYIELL